MIEVAYSLYPESVAMLTCDTVIRKANVYDGSGAAPESLDVAVLGDRILKIGRELLVSASNCVDAASASTVRRLIRDTFVIGTVDRAPDARR